MHRIQANLAVFGLSCFPHWAVKSTLVVLQLLLLLLALKINRHTAWVAPGLWILLPSALSAALSRGGYSDAERPVVRLWQLIGCLSATYALIHYPLMPPLDASWLTIAAYGSLLFIWLLSIACGVLCFRIPSVSLIPPAYLLWSNAVAKMITGMVITIDIDIQPLSELSLCIGLGLLISRIFHAVADVPSSANDSPNFPGLLLLIAIGIHLANYFWSFVAKMSLSGPFGAWLTENNPAYLFLVALDDDHVIFGQNPALVKIAFQLFDAAHFYTNFAILLFQAAAIIAFFLPKVAFVTLLVIYDLMHLSIFLLAGANFWPWIVLNLVITYVVSRPYFCPQPILLRAAAVLFIFFAPKFVAVTSLGWFDAGANNKLFFQAVDRNGTRHQMPTNFFSFYSYSIGHMDYGLPFPRFGLNVGSPNGSVFDYQILKASMSCDVRKLAIEGEPYPRFQRNELEQFIKKYHQIVLGIYDLFGSIPYDLIYPHHFYILPSRGDDFRALDKHEIVAYIYRQESVCLSFSDGKVQREIVGSGDFWIHVGEPQ